MLIADAVNSDASGGEGEALVLLSFDSDSWGGDVKHLFRWLRLFIKHKGTMVPKKRVVDTERR